MATQEWNTHCLQWTAGTHFSSTWSCSEHFKKVILSCFFFFPGLMSVFSSVSWMRKICPGDGGSENPLRVQTCQPVNHTEAPRRAGEDSRAAKGRGRSLVLGAHRNVGTPFVVKSSQSPSSEFNPGVGMKALLTHCPLTSCSLSSHPSLCPSPSPNHLLLPKLWKYPPNWPPWNQSLHLVRSPYGWQQCISKTQTWCCLRAPRLTRNFHPWHVKPFLPWASPCRLAHLCPRWLPQVLLAVPLCALHFQLYTQPLIFPWNDLFSCL